MSQWILLNKVTLSTDGGALVLAPARIIDDAQFDLDAIRAQGGVVWPASDPQMAQLASDVRARQQGKGLDDHGSTILTYGLALTKLLELLPVNTNLSEPAWFIDPLNASGKASDLNKGTTANAPLRTNREWRARLGVGGAVQNASNQLTVTFLSDMTPDDPFDLSKQVVGLNMNVAVKGTVTVVRTGTLTAVTPIDENNVGTGGNMLLLTDTTAGPVTWTDKQRISITTPGPRATARTFAKKSLGGGQATFTQCAPPAQSPVAFTITEVLPLVGDTYQVETLSFMYIAEQRVRSLGHGGALFTRIWVSDFHVVQSGLNWFTVQSHDGLSPFIFDGCLVDPIFRSQATDVTFMNCYLAGGMLAIGGLVASMFGGSLSGFVILEEGSKLILDQECYVTLGGGTLAVDNGCRLVIGTAGFFDHTADCITIFPGGFVELGEVTTTVQTEGDALFGTGNAGRIFDIQPGAQVVLEDTHFVLAVKTSFPNEFMWGQYNVGFYFDAATATYLPAGGLSTTFANLLAVPPAGCGGFMHFPMTNAHFTSSKKHT